MYTKHFGLNEPPFSITPDPRYLYLGHRHQEALAHLSYGVVEGSGFVALTGEVGTGKTTLCRRLLENTPKNIEIALVFNPYLSALELVATVCDELRIPYKENYTIKTLIDALNGHLLKAHAQGKRTVLIIDEAQNLSVEVLEQVRLLSNLETSRHKLLRIMLIGQPELRQLLAKPELRQLNQRVTARYHLRKLTLTETESYIGHRLSISGAKQSLFTKAAIKSIYRFSEGIPRLINVICDRALIGAFSQEKKLVDKDLAVHAALETLNISRWRTMLPNFKEMSKDAVYPLVGLTMLVLFWVLWAVSEYSTAPEQNNPSEASLSIGPVAKEGLEAPTSPADDLTPLPFVSKIKPRVPTAVSEPATVAPAVPAAPIADITTTPAPTVVIEPEVIQPVIPVIQKKAKFSIARITDPGVKQGRVFEQLFSLWQEDYQQASGKTFCAKARNVQLQCLKKHGGWSLIRQFNRPVLMNLRGPNKKSLYVLVQALPSNKVEIFIDQPYLVDFDELEPYWDEEFVLLWKPPKLKKRPVKEGDLGDDVTWVKKQLGMKIKTSQIGTHYFDGKMVRKVKQFQKEHLLQQDGVIGEQTLFYIVMFSQVTTDPVLQRTR